jgi:hypothetical protein
MAPRQVRFEPQILVGNVKLKRGCKSLAGVVASGSLVVVCAPRVSDIRNHKAGQVVCDLLVCTYQVMLAQRYRCARLQRIVT